MKLNEHALIKDIASDINDSLQGVVGLRYGYDGVTDRLSEVVKKKLTPVVSEYGLECNGFTVDLPHAIVDELGDVLDFRPIFHIIIDRKQDKRFKYNNVGTIVGVGVRTAINLRAETLGEYIDRIKVLAAACSFRKAKTYAIARKQEYDKAWMDVRELFYEYLTIREQL